MTTAGLTLLSTVTCRRLGGPFTAMLGKALIFSRLDGSAWLPGSPDLLLTAPGLPTSAVAVLSGV